MTARSREWAPIAALLAVYVLLVAFTFQDYGITYDEALHARYGDAILSWYRSRFTDRGVLDAGNLEYYGGFFDALAQAAGRVSPLGPYETRHLVNAIFGAVGVLAAWLVGRRLAGPRGGFLAALFLLATPVWYGHSFANPKDVPFAALYLLSLDAILAAVPRLPRIPWRHCVWLGVTIGLTLAVRFGGVLLFTYLAAAFIAWLFWRWRTTRDPKIVAPAVLGFAGRAAVVAAVAWVTMLPWWPAAQVRPIRQPVRTLRALGNFEWNFPVFFDGQQIPAMQLPRDYLPTWAALTLPEFVIAGVVVAAIAAAGLLVRRRGFALDATSMERTIQWGTLWLAALLPFAYAVARDSVVYDGLRHFLFVVPIFAVTAAAGYERLLGHSRPVAGLAAAFLVIAIGWTVIDMLRLHPYQYIWFNRAVAGGLPKASRSYETDYWGAAFKEAAEWVRDNYTGDSAGRPIRVATCSDPTATSYYLPADRFVLVDKHEAPDLFLGSSRWDCVDDVDGRVVYAVGRVGVALVTIKETGRD